MAYWQQLALESSDSPLADTVLAHVELAKHFEWHQVDLALAAGWTRAAITVVKHWPAGLLREDTLAELHHRLARLARKMDKLGKSNDAGCISVLGQD